MDWLLREGERMSALVLSADFYRLRAAQQVLIWGGRRCFLPELVTRPEMIDRGGLRRNLSAGSLPQAWSRSHGQRGGAEPIGTLPASL